MPTPAISIAQVTKTFGPKVAVRSLDLEIQEGALCGFIGPNGAGKTTTIRMIMSILFPDEGRISVLGKASAVESKDRIGYLPEERGVYRKMKVGAFLNYMARLKGIDPSASDRAVREWLGRMGLADTYKKRCEELSKGMQQKVQFITAVIHKPDLIILDEVFSGLDPVNRRLMRELIDEQHRRGCTIIFSTHAMFEAEQLCDQIFMIHKGDKVLDGSLRDIVARFDPRSLFVEAVAGDGETTLRSVPGVRDVSRAGRESARGALVAHLDEHADPGEVMRRVVAAFPVRRIEITQPSLEDIFIDTVLGTNRAGAASTASPDERESLRNQLALAGQEEGQ
ncbi:MAG: ABC transporter ATP-binding protein [Phycisphaerales bacterium]